MILIDSNIIIGYYNKEDYFHEQAKQILKEIDEGKWIEITTEDGRKHLLSPDDRLLILS